MLPDWRVVGNEGKQAMSKLVSEVPDEVVEALRLPPSEVEAELSRRNCGRNWPWRSIGAGFCLWETRRSWHA